MLQGRNYIAKCGQYACLNLSAGAQVLGSFGLACLHQQCHLRGHVWRGPVSKLLLRVGSLALSCQCGRVMDRHTHTNRGRLESCCGVPKATNVAMLLNAFAN